MHLRRRSAMILVMSLISEIDAIADETGFSGVVRVRRGDRRLADAFYGYADRSRRIPITRDTQFGIASGTKALTALTVASLVASGELRLDASVPDLLGGVLPLVDPAVTVAHLLSHTSGVGDYLDEELLGDVDEYVLDVPARELDEPSAYLPLLVGHPQKFAPGERFSYSNSGYVILSLVVEACCRESFYDLVRQRVLEPAAMVSTAFLRSDELPASAAVGYLSAGEELQTNISHLPVRGAGDGGAYSTGADIERLWEALLAGRIVPVETVETLVAPRSRTADGGLRYGMGFWLRADRMTVMIEGMDAGVSFRSARDLPSGLTYTVIANTSKGAWPIVAHLDARLPELAS